MTSQARVEANRKNAKKSTGPRSEAGKARVKFNALKHGLDAATVVLPHEDAAAYQQRLEEWTAELRPTGALGRYLAERAVRLSWQLDRADAHDTSRLARRSGQVAKDRDRSRRRRAKELLLRVLGPDIAGDPPHAARSDKGRDRKERPDDPTRWLARLKASAEGCRALLGAWDEVVAALAYEPRREADVIPTRLVDVPFVWALLQPSRMLRLLGVRDERLIRGTPLDPRVQRIIAIQEQCGGPAFVAFCRWDEARKPPGDEEEPRPSRFRMDPAEPLPDEDALRRELLAVAESERAAVMHLLERHEAEAVDEDADEPAVVPDAFDDSAEGERLHRYQTNWSRSLLRTLAALEKIRRDDDEIPEQSQPAEVKAREGQELGTILEGRSNRETGEGANHGRHGKHGREMGTEEPRTETRGDHESAEGTRGESEAPGGGGEGGTRDAGVPGILPLQGSAEKASWRGAVTGPGSGPPLVSFVSFVVGGPDPG